MLLYLLIATRNSLKMAASHVNPLAVGITGLVLLALLTIPTLLAMVSQTRRPKPKSRTYQDKDGISTEELTSANTAIVPKSLLLLFAVLGLATSIALAIIERSEVHTTFAPKEAWLNFGQWVSLRNTHRCNDC